MNFYRRFWDRKKIERSTTVYPSSKIISKVHDTFKNIKLLNLDSKTRVPTRDAFNNILRGDLIDEVKYQSNYFDCDKYALWFKSIAALHYRVNAIGFVISYSDKHAFNIVIVKEENGLKVLKLEPQNDKLWEPKENVKDNYQVEGEIILL